MKRITLLGLMLFCVVAMAVAKGKYVLVIDAGHGGKDPGTMANGKKEKDINLKVALAFGNYVEQNCSDVTVIYTRKTDVFIPLHERAAIANRNKANVFISIHTNAVEGNSSIRGMETYTMGLRRLDEKLSAAQRENEVISYESDYKQRYAGYDPKSPESMAIFDILNETNMAASVKLASLIQKHTCATAGRKNLGVKQDAFLVLRETSMPACLVELGYITSPSEAADLGTKSCIDHLGKGIYQAFVAFKNAGKNSSAAQPKDQRQPLDTASKQKTEQPQEKTTADSTAKKISRNADKPQETTGEGSPVFKVQILTGDRKLPAGSSQFKGLKNIESYKEGNIWKYTVGASTNYNQIYTLLKQVHKKFPGAFIIAFKGNEKMDVNDAIREFKRNKNKK